MQFMDLMVALNRESPSRTMVNMTSNPSSWLYSTLIILHFKTATSLVQTCAKLLLPSAPVVCDIDIKVEIKKGKE
jgi:hypothetical protein